MWVIEKIELKNVGVYSYVNFDIPQNKTLSIIGENQDDEGQESNGAGKSFLGEGFALGIIGSTLKKARYVDLIKYGADTMEVMILMSNAFLKKEMKIERVFPVRGSASLKVEINGVDQKDKFVGKDGDKFILDQIEISKDDLLGYYLISKTRYRSFFSSPDSIKKEVISRFSGADLLNGIDSHIDLEVNGFETKKKVQEDAKVGLESKAQVYEEDLEKELKRDLEAERQKRINIVEISIRGINSKINEEKLLITGYSEDIKDLNKEKEMAAKEAKAIDIEKIEVEISKLDEVVSDLDSDRDAVQTNRSETTSTKTEFETFVAGLKIQLAGVITCPSCEAEFIIGDADANLKVIRENVVQSDSEIEKLQKQIEEFNKKNDKLFEELTKNNKNLKEKKLELSNLEYKKRDWNKKFDISEGKITRRQQLINNCISANGRRSGNIVELFKDIDKIKKAELKSREAYLKGQLKENEATTKGVVEKIKKSEEDIFQEIQWHHNFKRFNSHLAVSALKTIEGRVNIVLRGFGSDLLVNMEGFKILASGQIREKISTNVRRGDGDEKLLTNYSSGEQARVEVASIIALQSLINQSTKGGGLSLLIIDEILESTDAFGMESILTSLNKLDKTILLVTHVGTDSINFENILLITKENGESTIELIYLN